MRDKFAMRSLEGKCSDYTDADRTCKDAQMYIKNGITRVMGVANVQLLICQA